MQRVVDIVQDGQYLAEDPFLSYRCQGVQFSTNHWSSLPHQLLHCHLRRLQRLNKCFCSTLKHEMLSYLLMQKKTKCWSYQLLIKKSKLLIYKKHTFNELQFCKLPVFLSYYYLIKTAQLQFEKTWFIKINKNGVICFCKWTLHAMICALTNDN